MYNNSLFLYCKPLILVDLHLMTVETQLPDYQKPVFTYQPNNLTAYYNKTSFSI
jgi:hypothetical protein